MTALSGLSPSQVAYDASQDHHASQRVDELAEAWRIAAATAPKIIVEIGCDAGGTLWAWRQTGAEVYAITLADNSPPTGGQGYPLVTHGATVRIGDSHDPASLTWLREQLDGRPVDVLHIDGDHSYAGVDADYEMYSPLVRPGGLVLVHDVLNWRDYRVEVDRWWADKFPDGQVIASKCSRPVGFGVITI